MFEKSYRKQLKLELHEPKAGSVMKKASKSYKTIIEKLPEFDKDDRFLLNILSCAMLSSVLLSVTNHYTVEEITSYYSKSMSTKVMKKAAKKSNVYTIKGRELLKKQAEASATKDNPYSWVFEVEDGEDINEYTATFKTCGICRLMTELGLEEYIPAMCAFDYDMAKMNNTEFTREYTLASGGPYCDCHYKHLGK